MTACLTQTVMGLRFPPSGKPTQVRFPLVFHSAGGAAAP
jgi:hypothetical protein